MEATDAAVKMLADLLIENSVMKALLRKEGVPDVNAMLRNAKADPERQRKVEPLLAVLRTALSNEVTIERKMQEIAETPPDNGHA